MGKFMDLLLIDNSNIFIEVKNLVGQDGRFDYDKFVKNYINSKNQKKILVGSTPPKSDGFWSTMKSKGFEVHTYERKLNGEKAVDTGIVTEGAFYIAQQECPGILNILSGDFDMFPLIKKAIEQNWQIVLWSWKDSLSNEYLDVKEITIKYLDDVAEDLIFLIVILMDIMKKNILEKEKYVLQEKNRSENSIMLSSVLKIKSLGYVI